MNWPGIYKGICTNNVDPEGLSRIRVWVPDVFGMGESEWAWPCMPPGWFEGLEADHSFTDNADVNTTETLVHALKRIVPSLSEPVWIMFEAGHAEKPVWLGTWRKNG